MINQSGSRKAGTVDIPSTSGFGRILKIAFFAFLFFVVLMGFTALISIEPRGPARLSLCRSNMRELGLAPQSYHVSNKHFPGYNDPDHPEYPPCSWRVQLLPQLQRTDLLESYDRTQPWDSSANVALREIPIDLLQCPADTKNRNESYTETDYVSIVGPNCTFREKGNITLDDITDGASNTIMLVESSGTGIHWMEPRDLNFEDARIVEDDSPLDGIHSHHADVINVTFCDGSAKSVSKDIDPKLLKALLTINGGEPIKKFHGQFIR